jgi:hypothetical protein
MAFFVPRNKEITAQGFAQLYVDHVWATQGLSKTFIFDRYTRFTSAFWRETCHSPARHQTVHVLCIPRTHQWANGKC